MRLQRLSRAWEKAGSRGVAAIVAVAAVAGLAACSAPPSSLSPVELYRSVAGFNLNDDTSGARNAQNLEAGSHEPYPNLGTVPPPPDRAMSSIDRQKLQEGLAEDRSQAKQTDADLRGSGAAAGAPVPITRPSLSDGSAAQSDGTRGAEGPLPGGRSTAHRRSAQRREAPPQESALNSPEVHVVPEGDTPRPAPPPPHLTHPDKARKTEGNRAAKAPSAGPTDGRPQAPQTTAGAPQARPPASAAEAPPIEDAGRIPPPPADTVAPASERAATVAMASPPAAAASATEAAPTSAPDTAAASARSRPPPLGLGETPKPSSQPTASLDADQTTPQAPVPPGAAITPPAPPPPAPVINPPEQQAALTPPPQAVPTAPTPDAVATPVPRGGKAGVASIQAAEISFADNGLTLTPEDDRRLADVVKLYDKHGGIVRVVGYGRRGYGADAAQQELASFSRAIDRANAVAKALTALGLASNRIVVQAAPVGDGLGEDRAEVLLEF